MKTKPASFFMNLPCHEFSKDKKELSKKRRKEDTESLIPHNMVNPYQQMIKEEVEYSPDNIDHS